MNSDSKVYIPPLSMPSMFVTDLTQNVVQPLSRYTNMYSSTRVFDTFSLSDVLRCRFKELMPVIEVPKASITRPAQQTSHMTCLMAMVYVKSLILLQLADSTSPLLCCHHSLISIQRDSVLIETSLQVSGKYGFYPFVLCGFPANETYPFNQVSLIARHHAPTA